MKKTLKVLFSLGVAGLSGALVAKNLQEQRHMIVKESLENAKACLAEDAIVTGSWIDTTRQFDSMTQEKVFVGAITTQDDQFNFISSAKTGEILYFESAKADIL